MKLSTKGRYGLRAMIDISVHASDGPAPVREIARRQTLSESYLEQLMSKLKRAGLIESVRGVQGGYILAREPDKISVGDILRALEGDLNIVDCSAIDGDCAEADKCATKVVWQRMTESLYGVVDNIALSELSEDIDFENDKFDCKAKA